VHTFSVETDGTGTRRFIAASYAAFWARYSGLEQSERHHYEVIPESSPCKLYFDVEYSRVTYPALIAHETGLVGALCCAIRAAVKSSFGFDPDPVSMIDLDSSTDAKFSRHLVFTDVVFADNREMGEFVATKLIPTLIAAPDAATRRLVLTTEEGHRPTTVIDEGVYTRNRNFRLYLSSKIAKGVPLLQSAQCAFPKLAEEHLFFSSLLTNLGFRAKRRLLRHATPRSAPGRGGVSSGSSSGGAAAMSDRGGAAREEDRGGATAAGYRTSPYPEIEDFISTFATSCCDTVAKVRRWALYEVGKTLTLDLSGNRYCERIGREHKSNGVYFVVSIERGYFYQKCYDSECRATNFKSTVRYVPDELLPPEEPEPDASGDDSDDWAGWLASGGETALAETEVAAEDGDDWAEWLAGGGEDALQSAIGSAGSITSQGRTDFSGSAN
jgi:hypothetical protein